jgi:hypothetical protein
MSNTVSSNTPGTQPSLSIQDLQNMLLVIDLAVTRGAFRGAEISQIGQVFDKLNQFVQSVTPQQPSTDAQTPPAPQPVQQMQNAPTPVMPMTPPFSPKVGV